jgi:hypothetical protein
MLAAPGEPNRFRLVELLRTGPRPVNDFVDRLALKQAGAIETMVGTEVARSLTVRVRVGFTGRRNVSLRFRARPEESRGVFGTLQRGEPAFTAGPHTDL